MRLPAVLTTGPDGTIALPPPSRSLRRADAAAAREAAARVVASTIVQGEIFEQTADGRWRPQRRPRLERLSECFAGFGGLLLAGYALAACLAAGPIGWLVGFFVVPIAFVLGLLGGVVGGFLILGASVLLAAALLLH